MLDVVLGAAVLALCPAIMGNALRNIHRSLATARCHHLMGGTAIKVGCIFDTQCSRNILVYRQVGACLFNLD